MIIIIVIFVLSCLIDLLFSPRLIYTRDKHLVLCYGIKERRYLVIF